MLNDLRYRMRALLRRRALDRELDAELAFHVEQHATKLMRSGLTRREAERRARVEFGGVERIREEARAARGIGWVDAVLQDVRYAWRGLSARPGFAAAVVLTLGLGIGANTTMFGVVDRLLVRPPSHLTSADRVYRVYQTHFVDGRERTERYFEYLQYRDLQRHTTSLDAVAAYDDRTLPVGSGADTRDLRVVIASASYFDFFSARPVLGRFFTAQDDREPEGARVAVLGHGYWQTVYGGRTTVLGEELRIDESVYTIIGVAPRGFAGLNDGPAPVAYVPLSAFAHARVPDYARSYGWSWLELLVRRRSGVSAEAAAADLSAALVRSLEQQREQAAWALDPAAARSAALLAPVHEGRGPDAAADAKVAAWVLGVAFIVLLVAAANVVNLLLARALHRRREVALRLALGVSRPRLVQQLLTETLVLALLGGAAGLLVARLGGGAIRALFLHAEDAHAVATDPRTLLFTAALTLAVALLTGLTPALQALRADVAGTLKGGMRHSAARGSTARTTLLLVQGALCVVLLVGAGLFTRSLLNVRTFRLGYDVDPLVVVSWSPRGELLSAEARAALTDELLAAALALPGVRSATPVNSLPFGGSEGRGAPWAPGRDSLRLLGSFTLQAGTAAYFQTMGTRIMRGRGITAADVDGAPPVIVLSESMAAAIWPGEDPIGRQLRFGNETMPLLTVVGVAEDISARRIARTPPEFWYYLPLAQYRALFGSSGRGNIVVRVDGRGSAYVEVLRQRLQRELPGAAYVRVAALADFITPQLRSWRLGATMFLLFAGLALVLASIGLYSVIAYGVAQRTRELGVRIALGASVARVVRLVVAQGVLFAVGAVLAGGVTAWFAVRWVEPLLFAVAPRDPLVFGGVAAVLVLVAIVATIVPAWRATRIDPTIALKTD